MRHVPSPTPFAQSILNRALPARVLLGMAVLLGGHAPAARAQDAVVNGGFETGALAPWSASATGGTTVSAQNSPGQAASGLYSAVFSNAGTDTGAAAGAGTLAQTLATGGGATYTLTFSAQSTGGAISSAPSGPGAPPPGGTALSVSWGAGTSSFFSQSFSIPTDGLYRRYTIAALVAPGPATVLSFGTTLGGTSPTGLRLDDISAVRMPAAASVPEPSSVAAFAATGFGAACLLLRARRREQARSRSGRG